MPTDKPIKVFSVEPEGHGDCVRIEWKHCVNNSGQWVSIDDLKFLVAQLLQEHDAMPKSAYVGICVRTPYQRCHEMDDPNANHFYDRARCCLVLAYAPACFIRVAEIAIINDSALEGYLTNSGKVAGTGVAGRDGQYAYLYLLLSEWDGVCHCEKCSAWQSRSLRADNDADDECRGYEPQIYKLGPNRIERDVWDQLLNAHARWVEREREKDPLLQRGSKSHRNCNDKLQNCQGEQRKTQEDPLFST